MAADSPPIAANLERERLDSITREIIGAAQRVSSKLGEGFLEKVYENSLAVELGKSCYHVEHQRSVLVEYEGTIVGEYIPDLIVEDEIFVEVKAVTGLDHIHKQQCINYLRATGFRVCLLLNFGRSSLEVRRLVNRF